MDELVVFGSGNVFKDLGLPEPEEALIKSRLAFAISTVIRKRGLTQSDAAALADIPQPKISLLVRGRTKDFSTDRLYRILNRLGVSVSVVLQPEPNWKPGVTIIREPDPDGSEREDKPAVAIAV